MTKRDRLDSLLAERDIESVWFARPNSFAWLTGGDNVIDREGDVGVAAVGYDGDTFRVVTNSIEGTRLRDEELPDGMPVTEYPWYESSLADAVAEHAETPAAADFDVPGFESVDASPLRQPLTDEDADAYRQLGTETAAAVEAICRKLDPDDTEREIVSAVRGALDARDIETPVALVGGSERAQKYRHYTPTEAKLGDYAHVSVTAERAGLHASCTRTVAFDAPEWLAERHEAAATVETTALAATQRFGTEAVGGSEGSGRRDGRAKDVFAAIQDAYDRVGYPGEWEYHHQGGAAGYAGREWIATPTTDDVIRLPMAYAWNPTVQGAKSEDTALVDEDRIEILTQTGDWPTEAVIALDDDVTLPRPSILEL
ncbi:MULTISPECIES: aminopeptidase P family protein [unclassified Haladaptatus]|uniref:M24 family metallopeptidase n=1 Tax=unclassified Haladaptatus TaxID=2622732 RepID=UPI00209BF31B|nr:MULTISPECIES: aminopeptidase P family protein [unclassified Haladaptatus]MCO8244992.1 M24 family metallopeptidase [Haladaptatus sp. AB643]MCO8253134.1 M24 family metallopeptidase [Haladaptatus sp. AB618]